MLLLSIYLKLSTGASIVYQSFPVYSCLPLTKKILLASLYFTIIERHQLHQIPNFGAFIHWNNLLHRTRVYQIDADKNHCNNWNAYIYVGQVITIYQSLVGTSMRCTTDVIFSFILFYMDNLLKMWCKRLIWVRSLRCMICRLLSVQCNHLPSPFSFFSLQKRERTSWTKKRFGKTTQGWMCSRLEI